ncbi:hypothetical protein [Actinacidiphila sp. ITFR-21]|uniref:hypothetical protein n=1 Tax=Actinacidiphila sp. ITFR-21 TaxID=3075199 RepID=UPI00288B8805|nr:hypothetical protein [Streptomyces sp. ITFR-21]WNI19193.1 hypothetical protein RLT57_29060 [Streptomyces sp. ITFR-21]
MTTTPGADELRIRHYLRDLQVDHNPAPDDDWWTALHGTDPDDDPDPDDPDPAADDPDEPPEASGRFRKPSGRLPDWRKHETADHGGSGPDEPEGDAGDDPDEEWEDAAPADESTPAAVRRGKKRQQAIAAWAGLEGRTRWLLSTGAGAGCGWFLGLLQAMSGWITACARDQGNAPGLILGLGMVAAASFAAYRTRGWWAPLAWCCRIPLATALLALCLYAPGVTP